MSDLEAALARIWDRSRPLTRERLERVEAAVGPLERGRCADPAIEDAQHAAHQLAGSLGTFGLHEGSDIARAIEHELQGPAEVARLTDLSGRLRALLAPRLA